MITYKDCPECGARKIRESVSLCEVCEVSHRYEKRIGELQALLDVAVKEREEWQAIAENTMDASSEGAWMARALDAERGLADLREFVGDEADEDCHYGDNCPSNAGTRHGTCRSCKARQVLSACGIHVWFERDNLEACRNCGVVRRADDGNKPCKGEVKVTLR